MTCTRLTGHKGRGLHLIGNELTSSNLGAYTTISKLSSSDGISLTSGHLEINNKGKSGKANFTDVLKGSTYTYASFLLVEESPVSSELLLELRALEVLHSSLCDTGDVQGQCLTEAWMMTEN